MAPHDDRTELIHFIDELHSLLEAVVFKHEQLFPADLLKPIHEAWKDADEAFVGLRSAIKQVDEVRLTKVGLTGSHLKLKLTGFYRAKAKHRKDTADGWRAWLLRLLKWANIILGSLGKVLDQADVIKEMKEALENGLEEGKEE